VFAVRPGRVVREREERKDCVAGDEGREENALIFVDVSRIEPRRAEAKEAALRDRRHGEVSLLPRLDVLPLERAEEESLVTPEREAKGEPALVALVRVFVFGRVFLNDRRHDPALIELHGHDLRRVAGARGQRETRRLVRSVVEEVPRVERTVIEEVVERAVKLVRARFRDGIDLRADAAPEFGVPELRDDLEFLDALDALRD